MSFYFELSEEDKYIVDDPDEMCDDDLEDFVAEGDGCPHCGERRVDYLEIQEDAGHDVFCRSCQRGYDLTWNTLPDIDMRREDYYLAGIAPPHPHPL